MIKINLAKRCSVFKHDDLVTCKICGGKNKVSAMPRTPTGFRFECKPCHHAKSLARYHEKRREDPSFSKNRKVIQSPIREAINFFKAITDRPDEIKSTYHEEYLVSSCGLVYVSYFSRCVTGLNRESITSGMTGVRGYKVMGLNKGQIYVHRLVMDAFCGNSSLYVNHINSNKVDNRIENLEYVSHTENMKHLNVTRKDKIKAYRHNIGSGRVWYSRINDNGKDVYLGSYFDKEDAINAYDKYFNMINSSDINRWL